MADLGSDISCTFDLDYSLTEVSGRRMLAEAVARRWLTRPGTLFYDPTYGYGLEALLHGEALGESALSTGLENEALRDERVAAASVSVRRVGEALKITGVIEDDDGPFRMVLEVGEVSVQLLLEEVG